MRNYYSLLAVLIALALPSGSAWSDISSYVFGVSTGSAYSMTGATNLLTGTNCSLSDDYSVGATNIGFNFVFDGVTYSKFSVSTNGVIGLFHSYSTTAVTSCWNNYLASATSGNCFGSYLPTLDSVPAIAPYWDDMRLPALSCNSNDNTTGTVNYLVTGSAPNRVLVIEYNNVEYDYYRYHYAIWQARLYETSNKIEFWYGGFSSYSGDGASIGIAAIKGRSFLSVTPGTSGAATVSSTSPNDAVNPTSPSIPANTIYTFSPCNIAIAGNTLQGGTSQMANGDSLLKGTQIQVGSSQTFQPFSLSLGSSPCTNRSYSYSITGPGAVNYNISPASGAVNANSSVTPTLTYTPRCAGKNPATLVVTGSDGTNLSYPLAGIAAAQNQWTGNVAQGGTTRLASGDTLLGSTQIIRKTTMAFQPFTIVNTNTNAGANSTQLTYTLVDPSGQFSITPGGATLTGSQSSTPTISVTPTNVGFQEATLTVSDGCDTRTFLLRIFSAAPGGELVMNGQTLGPNIGAFINQTSCAGEVANTQAITVNNIGTGNFLINTIDFYQVDTTLRQGTPGYPLLRDANNNLIPMRDYFISLQPGVAPVSANQLPALPIVVPQGQSRTIYITFVGQYPGKRFARAYINTNGQNFLGTDLSGNKVEGLVSFDLFARSTGSMLSDNLTGGLPKAVVFPTLRAGDSADVTFTLANPGFCDLRISRSQLRIYSGDVSEFRLISAFNGIPTDVAADHADYIFAPGVSGTITVRFLPSRSGSRRATLMLKTNDSTVYLPGVAERGTYYLDLFGQGAPGIEYANVKLPDAVIDAATNAGGSSTGTVELTNSSKEPLAIANLAISGTNASDFSQNPAKPWPTLPAFVIPGKPLDLSVLFTPANGSTPGTRTAQLDVTLSSGQIYSVPLSAYAGSRTISVTPTSLFDPNVAVAVGTLARRTVVITNNGTLNLTLQMPTVSGADQADFQLGGFPRLVLAPGQMEFLEVTYAPSKQGATIATLDVSSDATNGKQQVQLTAKGGVTQGRHDDAGRVAGVAGSVSSHGVELRQSVPNPASGVAEIVYSVSERGRVELALYDAAGKGVRQLASGMEESGEHVVRVDVSGLPSGVYHYRLTANGTTLTREITVVR